MSDLPKSIEIHEEGPREGFQIEPGPISTADKIAFINVLSQTGLQEIQIASFVNPKRVPGWADAEEVVAGVEKRDGVRYTGLWLNEKGLLRALDAEGLTLKGSISNVTSEAFMIRNTNRDKAQNRTVQVNQIETYKEHGIPMYRGGVMAAFGCNFEGEIPVSRVLETVEEIMDIADETNSPIKVISLADTMGWATPMSIKHIVGAVRERWPDLQVALHLHDTRGMGIANVYAGLEMGVSLFDSSVAGLGGCPFAGSHGKPAAGNVCTEDIVFMCAEMGIETGVDLERLIDAAEMAERIVGHDLPGSVKRGGSLDKLRASIH
jgi:hydroxymethylglutaryl-CoA lyase